MTIANPKVSRGARWATVALAMFAMAAVPPRPFPALLPSAEDQLYNEGGSSTTVAFSLVQGGLGAGTVDGSGNIHLDPLLVDPDGPDNIPGSVDDVVSIRAESPAINAGDNLGLPADKFDLDGDGDVTEAVPTDVLGAERVNEPSGSGGIVDLGAHESDASVVSVEPDSDTSRRISFNIPFPNPVNEGAVLRLTVPEGGAAEIAVFDVLGRKRLVIFDASVQPDTEYALEIDARSLESGVYFARLSTESATEIVQFVVAR